MSRRTVLLLVMLVAATAATTTVGAGAALACDTSYWNLGCQYYSPGERHTATDFCCSEDEAIHSTFSTYETIQAIVTTSGGTIRYDQLLYYDTTWYTWVVSAGSDKVGCRNHHTGTMFANCRHFNY